MSERILFVDDEKVLALLGQEMLEPLGYKVTIKCDSLEALDLFRADPDAFDLIVTDMIMPGLTGKDLAEKIRSIRSDIPIILCTGFNDIHDGKEIIASSFNKMVNKPYVLHKMAKTIRLALDGELR